jgi:hypothetical protein
MGRPTGRPPKPYEEKLRTGNPGKRALPERSNLTVLPAANGAPEPARPLGSAGRALWDRVWGAGATWLAELVDAEQVFNPVDRSRLGVAEVKAPSALDQIAARRAAR